MVDFDEEMKKLEAVIERGKEQKIDLVDFMQECTQVFEKVATTTESGSGRQRQELLTALANAQEVLDREMEEVCKESGKGYEEVLAFVENPNNFSQDTWEVLQKTSRRLMPGKGKKKRSTDQSSPPDHNPGSSYKGWMKT